MISKAKKIMNSKDFNFSELQIKIAGSSYFKELKSNYKIGV